MRITIQATIENADGSSPPQVIQVGEVTRDADVDPASGLGLFVRAANARVLSSMFEPLRRGQIEPADESFGRANLGLGLFIVQEVAAAHGGRVEVTSREGRTVFTVTFARASAET